jgi:hypothetical protein
MAKSLKMMSIVFLLLAIGFWGLALLYPAILNLFPGFSFALSVSPLYLLAPATCVVVAVLCNFGLVITSAQAMRADKRDLFTKIVFWLSLLVLIATLGMAFWFVLTLISTGQNFL